MDLREILQISNVPENHKLMRHAVLAHLENSVLKFNLGKSLLDNLQWQEFLRKYRVANSGVDKEGIILHAASQYLERNLVILTPTVTFTFKGGPSADRKPSIVMAATGDPPSNQEFWPVFQTGYYPAHPYPSHWVVRNVPICHASLFPRAHISHFILAQQQKENKEKRR